MSLPSPGNRAATTGRHSLPVNRRQLEFLMFSKFTWKEMAVILGVSVRTLQRRAKEWNIFKYSRISDADIDNLVREILQ